MNTAPSLFDVPASNDPVTSQPGSGYENPLYSAGLLLADHALITHASDKPITTDTIYQLCTPFGLVSHTEIGESTEIAQRIAGTSLIEAYQEQGRAALERLIRFEARFPALAARDEEKIRLQQFSTPLPYAYLMWLAAQVGKDDYVLEPSAGTGMIAGLHPLFRPSRLLVNELSSRRHRILKADETFEGEYADGVSAITIWCEDAQHISALLMRDQVPKRPTREGKGPCTGPTVEIMQSYPSVVLMNPPFSRDANVPSSRRFDVAARHLTAALDVLVPGGRLVAILPGGREPGAGMSPQAKRYRQFWADLGQGYHIRANIGVAGRVYARQGTSFNTRMVVIDRPATESTPLGGRKGYPHEPIHAEVDDLPALYDLIQGLPPRLPFSAFQSERPHPASVVLPEPPKTARTARDAASDRRRESGHQPSLTSQVAALPTVTLHCEPSENNSAPETGLFVPYRTNITFAEYADTRRTESASGSPVKSHPALLVETASMYATPSPFPKTAEGKAVTLMLPKAPIEDGQLSDIQLEAIALAKAAHDGWLKTTLPYRTEAGAATVRRGILIGDSTGVGKARELLGIILEARLSHPEACQRAVFVTETFELLPDLMSEYAAIGGNPDHLFSLRNEKGPIRRPEGILVTTYSMLGMKKRPNGAGQDRLGQVLKWLGGTSLLDYISAASVERDDQQLPAQTIFRALSVTQTDCIAPDFEGVIVFDEAHNMRNAMTRKGKRGQQSASRKALAGVDLQTLCPRARVVYASATAATEVHNLAYAHRLGLWGPGTPFRDAEHFVGEVEKGGMAAMEVVAFTMKAQGVYLSRCLSYEGVEYERLIHTLTPEQTAMYDTLARAWQLVLKNVDAALEETLAGKHGLAKSAVMSAFWGSQQRFFLQVICALQMPTVIKRMEEKLAEDYSCIVQITSTLAAQTERAVAAGLEAGLTLDELDLTPRDMLMQFIQNSFPVTLFQEVEGPDGSTRYVKALDSEGNQLIDPKQVARRNALLDELADLKVPHGPLDQIIDHFGADQVAEVTGRARRFVLKEGEEGVLHRKAESRNSNIVMREIEAFMSSEAQPDGTHTGPRILVFSRKGNTGRSYHASLKAKNQQRRCHIIVEMGWSSDQAVQSMGRSHRSAQRVPPLFVLASTNLLAQKRFVSTIARRLAQLGALTRGERTASDQGLYSSEDNLETIWARDAVYSLVRGIIHQKNKDWSLKNLENEMGLHGLVDADGAINTDRIPTVAQFLNRTLSLTVDRMNNMFGHFYRVLETITEAAKRAGEYDTGVSTIKADEVRLKERVPVKTDANGNALVELIHLSLKRPKEAYPFERVRQMIHDPWNHFLGFGRNRKSRRLYCFFNGGTRTNTNTGMPEQVYRRVGPYSKVSLKPEHMTPERYSRLDGSEDIARLWTEEMAGLESHTTEPCYMVTGAILNVWDQLIGKPRVQRVVTSADGSSAAGDQFLGRVIEGKHLHTSLRRMGVLLESERITLPQAAEALAQGRRLTLSNGWVLFKNRIRGQEVVQVRGPSSADRTLLASYGITSELIRYRSTYYYSWSGAEDAVERGAPLVRLSTDKPIVEIG